MNKVASSIITTTTTIITTTTTNNQIAQEHEEEAGTVYYDAVMYGEVNVSCNHTIINEALSTTSNDTQMMVTTPLSVSSPEQASENVRIAYSGYY